jgi:hydroxymethylpyrimidine/phosphomethylpyrimidine kinase
MVILGRADTKLALEIMVVAIFGSRLSPRHAAVVVVVVIGRLVGFLEGALPHGRACALSATVAAEVAAHAELDKIVICS